MYTTSYTERNGNSEAFDHHIGFVYGSRYHMPSLLEGLQYVVLQLG
jgi:hypothetical protein